jgi:hypothetical protein
MSEILDWQNQLAACQALGPRCSLNMRKPGDWYVSQPSVEVATNGMLEGRYGNGRDPEEAVHDHWRKLTTLKGDERVVLNAMTGSRREVRWNGFMWADYHG